MQFERREIAHTEAPEETSVFTTTSVTVTPSTTGTSTATTVALTRQTATLNPFVESWLAMRCILHLQSKDLIVCL